MKIVIDIPEEKYLYAKSLVNGGKETNPVVLAIGNGKPLPKGHGRISDIDALLEDMKATRTYDIQFALERVKPIIEADKEGNA